MQRFELAEDSDQRLQLLRAQAIRHLSLRRKPAGLRSVECGSSFGGYRHLARACIAAARDVDAAGSDQRIEIARQRSAIEQLPRREVRDPLRAPAREGPQQRELGDAQARRRHRVVVELRERTAGATQAAAGAGRPT